MKISYTKKYFQISIGIIVLALIRENNYGINYFFKSFFSGFLDTVHQIAGLISFIYILAFLNNRYKLIDKITKVKLEEYPKDLNIESNNDSILSSTSQLNKELLRSTFFEFAKAFKLMLFSIGLCLFWALIVAITISGDFARGTIEGISAFSAVVGVVALIINVFAIYKLYISSKRAFTNL